MDLRIAPCSAAERDRLVSRAGSRHDALHHQERFDLQQRGEGWYLLAWVGAENVGRATVYRRSKYPSVVAAHPGLAEVNALAAFPTGQGTGTALIAAAERSAAAAGHELIGLAVDPDEPANLRLYRRLGYDLWGHGEVVDEWTEHRDDGTSVHHADPSWHLLKELGGPQVPTVPNPSGSVNGQ